MIPPDEATVKNLSNADGNGHESDVYEANTVPELGGWYARAAEYGRKVTHPVVDAYVEYAQKRSPLTPPYFHEAGILWLASAICARRIVYFADYNDIFPNLWLMWLAPSTVFTKTTALKLIEDLAYTHAPHLLLPSNMTPEALLASASGAEPANLGKLPLSQQQLWQESKRHAAQRSLLLDEADRLLARSEREYNRGLLSELIKMYDCARRITAETKTSGLTIASWTYLSILTASTPAAMSRYLGNNTLWSNGFWPRFDILTPDGEQPLVEAERCDVPEVVSKALENLTHLPEPKPGQEPLAIRAVMESEALESAWKSFYLEMQATLRAHQDEWPDATLAYYGRLSEKILKVAMLLAALQWTGEDYITITQDDLARATAIVETWRQSHHRITEMLETLDTAPTLRKPIDERILDAIRKEGVLGITLRNLRRKLSRVDLYVLENTLDTLTRYGEICEYTVKKPRGPETTHYVLARTLEEWEETAKELERRGWYGAWGADILHDPETGYTYTAPSPEPDTKVTLPWREIRRASIHKDL